MKIQPYEIFWMQGQSPNKENRTMKPSTILVIGATGKTGRRIAQLLSARGHKVRAGSRRGKPAFDWDDPSGWPAALEGVQAAYISFYPDLAVPSAPAAIQELCSCARAAGVEKLVLLSGRGEANAQRCEQIVSECGLSFTLLRASWFAQNFSEGHLLDPVLSGQLALPAGTVREPFVDVEDIAEVAASALSDEGHAGQLYELTGPRLLSFAEAAAEISEASGRNLQYIPVASEDYRAALSEHAGAELAEMLTELMDTVLDGRNESLGDGVQRALGRDARDFKDYCQEAAASGIWNSPPARVS